MQLPHIEHTACPFCQSRPVEEHRIYREPVELGYEVRYFECGHEIAWIPSLQALVEDRLCPHSPKGTVRDRQRLALREKLRQTIDEFDAENSLKEDFLSRLDV